MAEVNVKIKAQNQTRTGFQQALGDAQRFGTSASGSLKSAFAGVASDIKSSIGGALAGLASLGAIRSIIDQFGRIQDLSEQFGVSAESLQRFGQLASESGSSIDQVAAAFSRLTINIQKAQGGTGAQADALRELGLSASELANLSPEEAFLRLADALQQAGGSNSSYAAALDLIGNRQRDLIPLLAQGSDAVRAQADAIDVASADVVAKVDEIGDRFGRLGQQIAVGLGPAVAFIGQAFLTAFAIVEAAVGKLASSITSSFAAVGQVLGGNFKAAGAIMRGEADATAEQWAALQQKLSQINSAPPQRQGRGIAAQLDAAEEADQGGKTEAAIRKQVQDEARIRQQVGEQLKANRRAGMSDDALLEDLKRQEKFLGSDRGGVSETELKRLQVVAQIDQLERQIAERKQRDAATAVQAAIEVTDAGSIAALQAELDALGGKEIAVIFETLGVASIDDAKAKLDELQQGSTATAVLQVTGLPNLEAAKTALNSVEGETVSFALKAFGVTDIDAAKAKLDSVQSKDVALTLQALGAKSIDEAKAVLDSTESRRIQLILDATGAQSIEQLQQQIRLLDVETTKSIDRKQRAERDTAKSRAIQDFEKQASARAFDAMSPAERQAELNRQMAQFESSIASGALTPQAASEQAARLMQMFDATNQAPAGFQGSQGASAFQRIGFASNEFFDTRTTQDPAKDTAKAAKFAENIYELLNNMLEPALLSPTAK